MVELSQLLSVNGEFLLTVLIMLVAGIIVGYIFAKVIKKLIIISIIIFILSYIGVISFNLGKVQELSQEIKNMLISALAPFIPSVTFIVGVIIGFILGL
ncbi:MAG: hypothetical protein QXS21_05875 [Thermoproteota archaeon]|nr:hypothetical protein [Candidatus Brockarchaeota archaeon]